MKTKVINLGWRRNRWWMLIGYALATGNLMVAIHNASIHESPWLILFNGALGGWLLGKLMERTLQ